MNPDQHLIFWGNITFYKCYMVLRGNLTFINYNLKFTVRSRQVGPCCPFYKPLGSKAVAYKVCDSCNFKFMLLGKSFQIRKPCHIAIILHYLTDHRSRFYTCKPCNIHRAFCMPCSYKNATSPRNKREYMTGTDKFLRSCFFRDSQTNSGCSIVSRYPSSNTAPCIYRNCKSCILRSWAIFWLYRVKIELVSPFLSEGKANKASSVLCHKIYCLRARKLGSNDQVTLVFPVFIVNEDYHSSIFYFFYGFFNRADPHTLTSQLL